MTLLRKLIFLIRLCNSFLFLGRLASNTAFVLVLSTSIRWLCTRKPKKLLAETTKAHFAKFICKESYRILIKDCSIPAKCYEKSANLTTTLLMYTSMVLPIKSWNIKFITLLIGCPCILQSEWHDKPFKNPNGPWAMKCYFMNIFS